MRQQTDDPGANHSVSGGVTGTHDFSGQDGYDEPSKEGAGDVTEVPVRVTDTSNPINGSGGSQKIIGPSKVKGCNP